jgi:hypothetical protein
MTLKKFVINRPVFTTSRFDSSSLAVLATLIHRFNEPGEYELFIRRGDAVVHRELVRVVKGGAINQIDVDLANPEKALARCEEKAYVLNLGGVMTFYATAGKSSYSVAVSQIGEKEKLVLLDSRGLVPEGDWYAVTLVQPGVYKVYAGEASGVITVMMPKPGGDYRTDQATLIETGKEGFSREAPRIFAGQTLVFQMNVAAQVRVELVEPDQVMLQPRGPGRFTAGSPVKGSPE